MKIVSQTYKDNIKQLGKQIDSYISYTINNVDYELGSELLNSVNLHYEGSILKSVMKQLDLETLQDIPLNTEINCKFGIKVADENFDEDDPTAYRINYEYIDLGNYIVYSSEKQEDTETYKLVCYDKMLKSMKDYERIITSTNPTTYITYPITIRNYINALCNHIGLVFANSSDTFVNYNKEILNEVYLDENKKSLNYTFRDVLDQLAQITASTICINEDDELEIRYINNTAETIDEESLKDINVNFKEQFGPINTVSFKRSADSDIISRSIPSNLPDNEKKEIVISDNQLLNGNNRGDYIDAILNNLYGLTYFVNDYTSTGITYLELCDKYNVSITKTDDDDNEISTITYPCIMLNGEINITQGLEEHIFTEIPEQSETDYNTTSQDDRTLNRTTLIVDKQVGRITATVSKVEELDNDINGSYNLTTDTTFKANKTYYKKINNEYVPFSQYQITSDETYQADTDYYSYNETTNEYILLVAGTDYEVGDNIEEVLYNQMYEIGDAIPSYTYYEFIDNTSIEKRLNQTTAWINSTGASLEAKTSKLDSNGNATSFKTTYYQMDGNGFQISDNSTGYKSLATNTGQYYYDNEQLVGKYTKDIAIHKDLALYGKYYYGIDDDTIDVANFTNNDAMFVCELYEDDDNELCVGHFYNGE